jgi:hypothetical protein
MIADLEMQQSMIEMLSRAKISVSRYKLDINPFLPFGPKTNWQLNHIRMITHAEMLKKYRNLN